MQEQPTREEFERLETRQKQLEEEVRKLKEQKTDEMKAINVNVGSADVVARLDTLEQDTAVLKIEMQGARADILQIRESQSDLRDRLIEHGKDLKIINEEQQAHKELLGQIINVGESHTKSFDQLKTDVSSIKSTQEQILKLLQSK